MGLQPETETIGNEIWRPIGQDIEHKIYYYIKYVRYYNESCILQVNDEMSGRYLVFEGHYFIYFR